MKISIAKIFHNFVTLLSTTVLAVQPVLAQNIAAAPTGPQVLTSASGIDLVMINGADANGISHNLYTDFNVGSNGVIFNNANTEFVLTDLAGWVQGNGNLAGGTAQIIINEVTGGSASSLNGFMEVAGDRADVVVANAYGITCNGCGFINTDRAVLTTGTTTFTNGNFTGFSVEQGGITIGEYGANALGTTRFDLISRQLTLKGAVAGHRLRVVTGRNDVTYVTGEAVEKAPDGSAAPALAIDSTVLGGMYGDSITILSTEDGVGVRAPENMAANAGEMVITADGRLVIRRASAVGGITATSTDDIVVEDSVIATGDVAVSAARDIALSANATLVSQSALTLDAGRNADFGAGAKVLASTGLDVQAGENITLGDGVSLASYKTLDLLGQSLTATGQSLLVSGAEDADGHIATADLGLTFQNRIDLGGAIVASSGGLSVESRILNIAAAGAIPAAQFVSTLDMVIAAEDITATDAVASAGGKLKIGKAAQDLRLQGGSFSADGAVAIAGQTVALEATILSRATSLAVNANSLTQAGYLGAATTLDIASAGTARLDGTVLAGGAAAINAGGALNVSGLVQATTGLTLAADSVQNSGIVLASAGNLALVSQGGLDNSGTLYSAGTLDLAVADTTTIGGQIAATGALDLQSSGALSLNGQLSSTGTLTLAGLSALSTGATGLIYGAGALDIGSADFNNAGTIASGGAGLALATTSDLINSGTLSAATALDLSTSAALTNSGKLLASGDITLDAALALTNSGRAEAGGSLNATAASLDNSASMASLGGALALNMAHDVVNAGTLQAALALALTLAADGALTNTATGVIMSTQAMALSTAALNNAGNIGTLNGAVTFASLASFDNSGMLSAAGTLAIAPTGALLNTGTLLAGADLSLTATQDFTNQGTMQALNNVSLTGTNIINAGKIQALNGTLTLSASGDISNNDFLFGGFATRLFSDANVSNTATIGAGGIVEIAGLTGANAASLTNAATAKITSGFNISLAANDLINHGDIAAEHGIASLAATTGFSHDGTLSADLGLIINADGGDSLSVLSDGAILNDGGVLLASQNMAIGGFQNPRALQFTNQNGGHVETFTGDISIRADLIENLRDATVTITDPAETSNTYEAVRNIHKVLLGYSGYTDKQTDYEDLYSVSVALLGTEARIISGRDIYMQGDTVTNAYSLISASRNIIFEAATVNNIGRDSFEQSATWSEGYRYNFGSCYSWNIAPENCNNAWVTNNWTDPAPTITKTNVIHNFGTIEAGGTIAGTISGTLTNGAVQAGLSPTVVSAPAPTLPGIAAGPTAALPTGLAVAPTAANALTSGLMQALTPDSSTLPGTGSTPATISAVDGSLVAGPSIGALDQPALFVTNDDPAADFLIETRFDFIDLNSFLSSDYFIGQIDFDPSITQKRLGDAYVETDYIRQQLFDQTGRRLLTPGVSEYDQMKAMYDGAINAAKSLGLRPGIALTPAQIAALTEDIIWLEEQVVHGQKVLVPRVYLAAATLAANRSPAKMVASAVSLDVGTFTNYGRVAAGDIYINASNDITNIGGRIIADNSLALIAANTIRNTNGVISGADVYLSATDIINETTATTLDFGNNHFDVANPAALITASNDLTMIAANDITVIGADLVAGHTGYIQAGGNITFAALALNSETNSEWESKGGLFGMGAGAGSTHTESVTHQVSNISTGAGLTIISTGAAASEEHSADILFEGTQVSAGGDLQIAALQGNVILGAVQDTSYTDNQSESTGFLTSSTSRSQSFDLTNQVTNLAGATIDVYAAGSLIAQGTTFTTGLPGNRRVSDGSTPAGDVTLTAASGDLVLGAVTDVHASSVQTSSKILFGLMGNSRDIRSLTTTTTGIGGHVAGNLNPVSGRDFTSVAAGIKIDGAVTTDVAGDTYLLAAVDTSYTSSSTMGNNGIVITNTVQTDLTQTASFNRFDTPDASFDPDSKITLGAYRDGMIDAAHPAAWVGNADGTDRLAIAGAYLGREDTSGPSSTDPNSTNTSDTPVPHWRTAGDWEDDQLLLASLPTASDGPGYGYLEDLLARDSTVVESISLLDDHFYDQQKQLNPAFKALLSIAIAPVTGGLGLGTFGSAAAASFATEAVGGVLTGHFDLEQALAGAAFAGGSSWATSVINVDTLGITLGDNANVALLGFGNDLTLAAIVESGIDSAVTAGLSSAVYGTDFGKGFLSSFGSSIARLATADFQTLVGDQGLKEGGFAHAGLHALVGCASAVATGADCAAGALGGVVESVYAGTLSGKGPDRGDYASDEDYAAAYNTWQAKVGQTANLIGGAVGYVFSGGSAANVSATASIAKSGILN